MYQEQAQDIWFNFGDVPGQIDQQCEVQVPLHSPGVWGANRTHFLNFTLPRLELQLALIFIVTQSLHVLFKRLYMPRAFSELLAGFILGKTFMGKLFPNFKEALYPESEDVFLDVLSKIGFTFFMFMVGVKMDPSSVTKAGVKGLTVAICVSLFPIALTYYVSTQIIDLQFPVYRRPSLTAVLSTQTIVPFPVVAWLLIDLKIMNSELGRIALASSLISNLISTSYTTVLSMWRLQTVGFLPMVAYQATFLSVFCGFLIVIVMYKASKWIVHQTPEGKPVKSSFIAFIVVVVLLVTILSDNVGLEYSVFPFLLGIVVLDGPPLGSTLVDRLDTLVSGLLAPLMMTFCALKVDLWSFYDGDIIWLLWKLILGLFGLKLVATFVAAMLCKVPVRDAAALSAVLNIQGIVEVATYQMIYKNQTIDDDIFGTVILSVLLIQACVTIFVRLVYNYSSTYRGYQKRSILHTTSNTELRVLACAHRQDDVLAAVKLLEVSTPTKDSPITAYALNLVELVGRATPLLINHGFNQKGASVGNRSEQMIETFQNLENRFSGLISFQAFTSVSLPKFMHHDVCSLAFDKLCSLIILPFHKKWNHQGQVIFNNNMVRTININILDMAPCSVGIFIDRRKIRHEASATANSSVQNMCIIFVGGDDDREALAYGKRLAKSSSVLLTVVRLVAADSLGENQWDMVLDTEALKDMKVLSAIQSNIVYREEMVKDGTDTALIINEMEEAFDMIVAGRRHRDDSPLLTGLTEWSELPELGAVGDILAYSEVKRPVSVLILQQQIMRNK